MKKLLNKEIVQQAITKIQAQGERPTIERIRKITGGSPKTIITIKRLIEADKIDNSTVSCNDNTAKSDYHSELSLTDIDKRIDVRFDQLKNELLHELKKKSGYEDHDNQLEALEKENARLKRDLLKTKGELDKASNEFNFKRRQLEAREKHIETLETENNELKQQFYRLQSDYKRQETDLKETLDKVDKLETELKVALSNVDSLAAENESFSIDNETQEQASLFESKKDHLDSPKIELVIEPTKLINPTTKERCFELFKSGHKQKDIVNILDIEGFKNTAGKKIGSGTVSKWYHRWSKEQ